MKARQTRNGERIMSLASHFRELRKRLILALAGWGVASIAGWWLYDRVIDFIGHPLENLTGTHAQLNFQTISAAFDLKVKVAVGVGMVLSSPWWIFQIAAFISPGLKRGEKAHVFGFGLVGAVLFAAGAFSGILVAPRAVEILVSFVPDDAAAFLTANSYVSFYSYLVIAFGVSFLLPELLVAANFLGVAKARSLLKGWRVATMLAFTFAAVINPVPNPVPMIIQALGLMALYFLAVGVAWLHDRRVTKNLQADVDIEI